MKKLSIALITVLSIAIFTSCAGGDSNNSKNSSSSESTQAESTIATLSQDPEPPEPEPLELPTLGDTFTNNGFEVTLGKELGDFKKVDNKYSEHHEKDVVVLPMTIKNVSGGKNLFNPLFVKVFAPDGVQSRYLGVLFADDDVFRVGDMMDGGEVETNFHFEYRGDGDYHLEFTSATDYTAVKIPVLK